MAASEHCKPIDYHTYRINKRLTAYNRRRCAGQPGPLRKQAKDVPLQLYRADIGRDSDHQLQAYENSARRKCFNIYKNLALGKLPGGLEEMLCRHILPTLQRIGFETHISKMLFEIAPSAWKLMRPVNNGIISFQPLIGRKIEAVRQEFKSKFDHENGFYPRSAHVSPGVIPGSINESPLPENLFRLLDQISAPWIILPRALRFMEKEHCRYLPVYIKILDAEESESCLKLFSRITVEIIANFSFKFADRHHPRDQLSKLLFYGYAALFWKALRCPPKNLENSAVFDHFFTWVSRFARQNDLLGEAEHALVDQMIKMKTVAFPAISTKSYRNSRQLDSSRFLVTLRHGTLGMAATLRHFGIDPFLKTRRTGKRFTCLSLQKELLFLLYQIRTHYHSESKSTQENIKDFIKWMKAACDEAPPDFNRTQQQFVDRLLNHMQQFVSS